MPAHNASPEPPEPEPDSEEDPFGDCPSRFVPRRWRINDQVIIRPDLGMHSADFRDGLAMFGDHAMHFSSGTDCHAQAPLRNSNLASD